MKQKGEDFNPRPFYLPNQKEKHSIFKNTIDKFSVYMYTVFYAY